ncbi:hypothetical protein QWY31_02705 [Cytophagales bacterium LB-30]|uniref:Uncharacterized protein n=1 Tax=Shiella aurantiaca TaxID=3058365 RepID=A0ABT8F2X4_9BACT|nr:hypothetical protein [Shiella aurantiaca]MDN4164391.1 hypothetical protein [Shiella aurantiaca]
MSEWEFDLLDELYFVQPYTYLEKTLQWPQEQILSTLQSLYTKGYLRCLHNVSEEVPQAEVDLPAQFTNYHYLATKAGLLAHNTR